MVALKFPSPMKILPFYFQEKSSNLLYRGHKIKLSSHPPSLHFTPLPSLHSIPLHSHPPSLHFTPLYSHPPSSLPTSLFTPNSSLLPSSLFTPTSSLLPSSLSTLYSLFTFFYYFTACN
jgi:hypothetical protein